MRGARRWIALWLLTTALTSGLTGCGESAQGSQGLAEPVLGAASASDSAEGAFDLATATTFEQLRDAGFAAASAGDDATALTALERARALKPDAYGVNVRLGQVATRLGRPELAIDALEAAIAKRPDDVESLRALGSELALVQRHADAYATWSALLDRAPDDMGALKGLIAACWRSGREDEAARWQEILDLFLGLRDNVFTRVQADASLAAEQSEAVEHSDFIRREVEANRVRLERLIVLHPSWGQGFLDLADIQKGAGEAAVACATYHSYLELHGAGLESRRRQQLELRYCR